MSPRLALIYSLGAEGRRNMGRSSKPPYDAARCAGRSKCSGKAFDLCAGGGRARASPGSLNAPRREGVRLSPGSFHPLAIDLRGCIDQIFAAIAAIAPSHG